MANAVLYDILEQIRTDIQALALPGIPAANVLIQKVPSNKARDVPADKYPCVIIAPYGPETISPAAGTNNRDDIVYPVLVAVLASDRIDAEQPQQRQVKDLELYLQWRETLRKSFINQRLTQSLVYMVQVQPLDIVDRDHWDKNGIWASAMLLKCFSREART